MQKRLPNNNYDHLGLPFKLTQDVKTLRWKIVDVNLRPVAWGLTKAHASLIVTAVNSFGKLVAYLRIFIRTEDCVSYKKDHEHFPTRKYLHECVGTLLESLQVFPSLQNFKDNFRLWVDHIFSGRSDIVERPEDVYYNEINNINTED